MANVSNSTKCANLKISNELFSVPTSYTIATIHKSPSARVTIDHSLNQKEHTKAVTKANSVNAFLKRNLSDHSIKTKKTYYPTRV